MDNKLNKRETYKARYRPYDYYEELQKLDFENLGDGDRYYLQDFGIFTTDFLEDEFTLRIRIPGGDVTPQHFSELAKIVSEYDLTIILTARSGIQFHDIDVEDILEIHTKVNNLGLTTWQSFGDNIRNIVTDPYDSVGKYSVINTQPLIEQMQEYILKNPRYVGMLPRRVSIGISGNSANVVSFFANDIYFALAKKDDQFGFNVYMGGKNTEVAKDIDIFLREDEVVDFFKAFVEVFYLHGSRFSRSKTRLLYLIRDIGVEKLKEYLRVEFKKGFQSAGKLVLHKAKFEQFEQLKDGTYSFRYETEFSKLQAKEIEKLADFALKNQLKISFGIDQNIYFFGLKEKSFPFASPANSATVIACAGNLCPYTVWSIKGETSYLPLEKISQHQINVGFSGCAKGCGRHRHTDIGLIGLKTNNFGDTDGGARVFIGALHTNGNSVSRELFSMVPFVHLKKTITLIIELFELTDRETFEEYSYDILENYSENFLSLWHLANLKYNTKIQLQEQTQRLSHEVEKELLLLTFKEFVFVEDNFKKTISVLVKELWTVEGKDPKYKPKINRVNYR